MTVRRLGIIINWWIQYILDDTMLTLLLHDRCSLKTSQRNENKITWDQRINQQLLCETNSHWITQTVERHKIFSPA